MRDFVVGGTAGLLMGGLAGLPWLIHQRQPPEATPPTTASLPRTAIASPSTDLDRAVRILARHAGEGWIRCPVDDAWPADEEATREWSHATVQGGTLVATVAEPEGSLALHAASDPSESPPRVVVRWSGAFPDEPGRCQVMEPEPIEVTGVVVGRSGRPLPGGWVHGPLGRWAVDRDGFFHARCYRGAPCALTPEPAKAHRIGRTALVVIEDEAPIELVYAPASRSWLAPVKREVDERDQQVRMLDPIDLALQDPLLPMRTTGLLLRWKERDEAERMSTAGLLDAVASD
ncbi:MAG: hypothetical protein AAGA48_17875 [Myxococcota bacterium]